MFSIRGMIDKKTCSITYRDGKITGEAFAVEAVKRESQKNHGVVGLGPDSLESNYLDQEIPAHELMVNHVFDGVAQEENDWEPVPEDAIF